MFKYLQPMLSAFSQHGGLLTLQEYNSGGAGHEYVGRKPQATTSGQKQSDRNNFEEVPLTHGRYQLADWPPDGKRSQEAT